MTEPSSILSNHQYSNIKYFIYSGLAGISCKLYDDFQDNKLLTRYKDEYGMETLKGIHYILVSVLSFVYPWFYVLLTSLRLSQYGEFFYNGLVHHQWITNSYENPYEFVGLLTYIVLFGIILYNRYTENISHSSDTILVFVVAFASILENISSNEKDKEVSTKKLMTRIGLCIFIISLMYSIPSSKDTRIFAFYVLGYLTLSIGIQTYSLYFHSNPNYSMPHSNSNPNVD